MFPNKLSIDSILQVAYEDFKYKKMHELAMATLDEIPREVCNYFRKYAHT